MIWTEAENTAGATVYVNGDWVISQLPGETGWWLSNSAGELRFLAHMATDAVVKAAQYI